jgi:uncharacterized membrane protein YfcA
LHALLIGIYLIVAGIASGLTSSMAGMGSIFSYPVLLSLGVPPVSADVTNTAALIFTGVGASVSSTKELHGHGRTMWQTALISLVGGIVGSFILVKAPATSFQKVVPFLIMLAGILMLITSHRAKKVKSTQPVSLSLLMRVLRGICIFLVGLYIGYFGASAGVILLAVLGISNNLPFAVNNAVKNFSSLLTNIFSLVIYAFTTKVYWALVVPLGIGFFIGGYIGPVFIRRIPAALIRNVIAAGAFILAGYLFYTAYFA